MVSSWENIYSRLCTSFCKIQRFLCSVDTLLVLSPPQNASILPALGCTVHGRRGRHGTGIPSERQQETSQDTRRPGATTICQWPMLQGGQRAYLTLQYSWTMKHIACHLFQVTQILRPPGRHWEENTFFRCPHATSPIQGFKFLSSIRKKWCNS